MALVFLAVGLLLVVVQIRLVAPVSERLGPLGALQLGLDVQRHRDSALLAVTRSWLLLVPALALLTVGQGIAHPEPRGCSGRPRPR